MSRIRYYQSQGEPVLVEDFNRPAFEDGDSPVPELRATTDAVMPDEKWERMGPHFPLTDRELARLRIFIDSNAEALAGADAATEKRGEPDWHVEFHSPAIAMMLPDLKRQRALARVLQAAAFDAHQRGDDAEALRRVRQMLFLSRAVYRQPFLIGNLVGVGIAAMACDTFREIAPDLRIGTAGNAATTKPAGHPASPQQVRELI